jgi:metal-responsive CopG/Arc/MetJ family transcriptional regulator
MIMKTIAISIDEQTETALERLIARMRVGSRGQGRLRSRLVRAAICEFVAREEKRDREEREAAALSKHRKRLARQLEALVAEQAKL